MDRFGESGNRSEAMATPPAQRRDSKPSHRPSEPIRSNDAERTDGRTLRKLLEESGRLDWQDVADLGIQLAEGLADRHRQVGAPHRLIMPDTVLRTRDGLGYFLADSGAVERMLRDHTLASSEEYRAPEEWRAPDKVDVRCDQFGLGIVLHEALAGNGKRPFDVVVRPPRGDDGISASYTPRHDLRTLAPDAPEELIRVIERTTRLNPNNRFEDCGKLAAALRSVLEPPTPGWTAPAVEKRRVAWPRFGLVAIALVSLAVVGFIASRLLVNPPGHSEMQHARVDADRVQAPQFASGLWRQAEMFQPAEGYRQRADLYTAARNQAWNVRLAAVVDIARQAVELGATGEESFQRAEAARAQALQQWTGDSLADASQSLTVADAGFRNAVAARRTQWAGQIQQNLTSEVSRLPGTAPANIAESVKSQQAGIQRILEDTQASPEDLRSAEHAVGQIRQAVATQVQLAEAAATEHRDAESALVAAERTRRVVERLAELSPRTKSSYDQGSELLATARARLDKDPAGASELAESAMEALQKVETLAEVELATQRRLAQEAQRHAEQVRARAAANSATTKEANRATEIDIERVARPVPPPLPAPPEKAAVSEPAVESVRARVETLPPPRPQEPMSMALAHEIQGWMSQRCEDLNRELDAASSSRARCESLTVHDRQNLGKVQISYVLTVGGRSPGGWEWQKPDMRHPVLDCSGSACRCLSGC